MLDAWLDSKRLCNLASKFEHRARLIRSDVEHFAVSGFNKRRSRDDRSDVIYVRERTRLLAVAKNSHWLGAKHLIHENANHVSVLVGNVLALTIHVMRSENCVRQSEDVIR